MNYFEVNYKDSDDSIVETVSVKRVPRAKLNDLIKLQQSLLSEYVQVNAAIGSIISKHKVWNDLIKIAALLPIVGKTEIGLDLDAIENDLTQLCRIFFTQSMSVDGVIALEEGFKPSLISELHQLDYSGDLGKAVTLADSRKKETLLELQNLLPKEQE